MRVIKYFYEEPTLLDFPESASGTPVDSVETLVQLMKERNHYRGYLAASDLGNDTIGGSALEDGAAAKALASVLEGPIWLLNREPGATGIQFQLLTDSVEIDQALSTMSSESVLIAELNPRDHDVTSLMEHGGQKESFRAIIRLLEMGATVVFPEPAHVGHDWSVFSARPLSGSFKDALAVAPSDCRSFVIPYVKARGEHKFYFEQYDLDLFATHEVK